MPPIASIRRNDMQTADLNTIEMHEAWYEQDPAMRITVTFPYFAGTGNQDSAVVYFAIEPGHYLGTHTDSAEEILLLLSGTVEARLGDEVGQLSTGQTALIPAMVPHGLRNIGEETARCVGFFAAAQVTSTFDQVLMPFGQRVAGTPPVGAAV
jgi:quercetin dioxygenase-like cupin family protein